MRFLLILFCVILLVVPSFVLADAGIRIIEIPNPIEAETIGEVIEAITGLLKLIAISIGTIMVIVAGIQIMTGMMSGEKESKVVKGKKTLTYTVIGVAIVILVDFIVGFVKEILEGV